MPYQKTSLADAIKSKNAAIKGKEQPTEKFSASDALKAKKAAVAEKRQSLADRIASKQATAKEAVEDVVDKGESLSEEVVAELKSAIGDLKEQYSDFVKRVQLTDIVEDISQLGNDIAELPDSIAELRQRGYVFHSYLENKLEVLAERWDDINDRVEEWLDEENDELEDDLAQIEKHMSQLSSSKPSSYHQKLVEKLQPAFETMGEKIDAAEEKIRALFAPISTEASKTKSTLRKLNGYMDTAEGASFDFHAGETVFMVADGEWTDGRDKPDGNLYVTNQRIIFEQDEKTGKRLGMFGGKQTKETLWEVEHGQVEKVMADDRGMFGGKDMMVLKASGASFAETTVEIKGGIEAKTWAQQVNRAVKGLIAQDSAVEEDSDLIERLQKSPTACPNCGGTLPKLSAGSLEANCEFCGAVVRA